MIQSRTHTCDELRLSDCGKTVTLVGWYDSLRNVLPFEIRHSKEADENIRLKYRYLDLRNPAVKDKIVLRSRVVAELRQRRLLCFTQRNRQIVC